MVKKGHHDQHTTDSISSAINAQLTKSANKTCYSSDKYFRIRPICKIDLQHARKYCIVIFNLKCSQTHTTTLQYKLEHSKYSQLLPQSTKTSMHLPIYRDMPPQPGNPRWIQNLDVSSPEYEISVFPTQTPISTPLLQARLNPSVRLPLPPLRHHHLPLHHQTHHSGRPAQVKAAGRDSDSLHLGPRAGTHPTPDHNDNHHGMTKQCCVFLFSIIVPGVS